jgi:hypothetical protein
VCGARAVQGWGEVFGSWITVFVWSTWGSGFRVSVVGFGVHGLGLVLGFGS